MTDQEINIAIAEACGWKPVHYSHKCDGVNIIRCGACGAYGHSNCYGNGTGQLQFKCADVPCCEDAIPKNYCEDLNAMAEAERTLEDRDPADEYANALGEIAFGKDFDPFDHYCWPPVVKAIARQRAEAFLKTIGKWTE